MKSHRDGIVPMHDRVKPSQPELEQTEVAAVLPVDQADVAVVLTQGTEINDPEIGSTGRYQ
ncbi:MAG: hypothetical protein AB7N91_33145 [Candidatus Tectimicrobiota bacterium]